MTLNKIQEIISDIWILRSRITVDQLIDNLINPVIQKEELLNFKDSLGNNLLLIIQALPINWDDSKKTLFDASRILIDSGIKIEDQNNTGTSILRVALSNNNIDLVKYLYMKKPGLFMEKSPYSLSDNYLIYEKCDNVAIFEFLAMNIKDCDFSKFKSKRINRYITEDTINNIKLKKRIIECVHTSKQL